MKRKRTAADLPRFAHHFVEGGNETEPLIPTTAPEPATDAPLAAPPAGPRPEAGPPPEGVDVAASVASYQANPPHNVNGWELKVNTPTIKAYVHDTRVLVAVRGTADREDLRADVSIPLNRISGTTRYQTDARTVRQLIARFHGYRFYLTGHSLGSAISLQLTREFPGVFVHAEEFNGALQPRDILFQNQAVHETYASTDPLYLTGGRFWRYKRVIPTPNINSLTAHKLATLQRLL